MKLPMSNAEIARRYRNALDPKKAIKILAQLNGAGPSDITAALIREGVVLDTPPPARKKRKRLDQQEVQMLYDLGFNQSKVFLLVGRRLPLLGWHRRGHKLPVNWCAVSLWLHR